MTDPYHSYQITSPVLEARGDWPPLPPQYPDGGRQSFNQPRTSEIVPGSRMPIINEAMPSNFGIPPWNNLKVGLHDHEVRCTYTPALNDTRKSLPSWRGVEFHEGRLAGSPRVGCGTSNELKVCRLFHSGKKCIYGDQCRFLHEIPEKTRNFGLSSQNYEARILAAGHVMDRRSGFDQLQEVGTGQTKIDVRSEIPKPVCFKTKLCYTCQMTGHCPYGKGCRFAHGEAELQKLGSCSVSECGSVGGTSATTSAAAEVGLKGSRGIGTNCKNKASRMKQFFKSKDFVKLIGIYADWLEDLSFPHDLQYKDLTKY